MVRLLLVVAISVIVMVSSVLGYTEPEMEQLEGGCFQMGSPDNETGPDKDEEQHQVCVESFAIGKYEVTINEFQHFVQATNYQTDAEQGDGCYGWTGSGWKQDEKYNWHHLGFDQSDDHPVSCVSWNDATAYAEWLTAETGKTYRLPTEAEWEYAARAQSQTLYFWGNDANDGCEFANAADLTFKQSNSDRSAVVGMECDDGFVYTAPATHFQGNSFGLHNMLGNVEEWTCSGYVENYDGSETKCADSKSTAYRVYRGGSWSVSPRWLRSAGRSYNTATGRDYSIGFRLVRFE